MHQLFSAFIREISLSSEDRAAVNQVAAALAARFLELAEQALANPADLDTATLLLDYPLTPGMWGAMGGSFTTPNAVAGRALLEVGRFEEARPWFERAVAEAEKGDVHGRVQSELVTSISRNLVRCLRRLGRHEDALQWERRYARDARN